MLTIGLLYTKDDSFSLLRSEMLVGPMLMAKVKFVRFLANDIHPTTLLIKGEIYQQSQWRYHPEIKLDVILDLSIPQTLKIEAELALLDRTPHSKQIDADNYELLQLISSNHEFNQNIISHQLLSSFEDILEAENKWGMLCLKDKRNIGSEATLILEKINNKWQVYEPYSSYLMDEKELCNFIQIRLKGHCYLQEFIPAVAYNNQALMFKLIVQQRFDGAWMTPIVRAVISSDGPLASLSSGGEQIGTPLIVKDNSYIRSKTRSGIYLNQQLQRFAVAIAQFTEEAMQGSLIALELKIVFDENLTPRLLSLDGRANAPSMPGRTIEFYRHLTDFAIGLSNKNSPTTAKTSNKSQNIKPITYEHKQLPDKGITIRNVILEKDYQQILDKMPKIIDIGLGYGGRNFLSVVSHQIKVNKPKTPILSLRIGTAQNDIIKNKKPPTSIIAIDEFIGQGLIRWSETTNMRSIRLPLLKKQFALAQQQLQGTIPDIIWLEDADLGINSLSKDQQEEELTQTASWFEQLCQSGQATSWGIFIYYPHSQIAITLIEMIIQIKKSCPSLTFIATHQNKILNIKTIELLEKTSLKPIIMTRNISSTDINQFNQVHQKNIPMLNLWEVTKQTEVN